MTRRLQTVVYACPADETVEELHTGAEIASGIVRRIRRPELFHRDVALDWRYELELTTAGWYDTATTTATVKQGARGGDRVREWARVQLLYDEPDDTTVEARLHTGTGSSIYWDGGAWSAAGASDWNTPDDLESNFSSLDAATYPQIGVEWRLQTTDRRVTPAAFGALVAARLLLMSRYQLPDETPDAAVLGSDSWADDLIHRVLLPWIRDGLEPERTDQRTLTSSTSVLDYSNGVDDSRYVVDTVQAVYNLDADADMESPLAGSWSASTKRYTLTSPLAAGTLIAVRYVYEPIVAYQGGRDLFLDDVPQVLVESIDRVDLQRDPGSVYVRRCTASQYDALTVPAPVVSEYRLTLLLQADGHLSIFELISALERLIGSGQVLVSDATGLPVYVVAGGRVRPIRGDTRIGSAARIDLRAWATEYHGAETTETVIKEDGVTLTVMPARTNYYQLR